MKFLPFQKNVIIFKSKASIEKRKTVLTSNNSLNITKNGFSFPSNTWVCFSEEHFLEFLPFKRMWLYFKVEFLQRKRTLFSLLRILWHIANNGLSFQINTCVFLTKAFLRILTLQQNIIIFQNKASAEKKTMFSRLKILWHIPNNGF